MDWFDSFSELGWGPLRKSSQWTGKQKVKGLERNLGMGRLQGLQGLLQGRKVEKAKVLGMERVRLWQNRKSNLQRRWNLCGGDDFCLAPISNLGPFGKRWAIKQGSLPIEKMEARFGKVQTAKPAAETETAQGRTGHSHQCCAWTRATTVATTGWSWSKSYGPGRSPGPWWAGANSATGTFG